MKQNNLQMFKHLVSIMTFDLQPTTQIAMVNKIHTQKLLCALD
jgi:hypothetical protein